MEKMPSCYLVSSLTKHSNLSMNQTDIEKARKVLDFMKESWCIDGEASFATQEESKDLIPAQWIKLTDSKRGTFYITRNRI